ncbi:MULTISPECIES: heavy metal translocating P-type ATPase [unclassified Gordonia (in: high G+C Gram-positive bacteria)]|uniref:heavy metal translocating P-type ATPase n=1 Tax=Gordonia TaxID=2053 RepID=UPI001B820DD9|nr:MULTISPECIES: heavy metal translocating P-type ATPase [unclassified Gordonia (in: high G+C Gram-positive bacteria)]MBR7190739.1 cadmium-translocating P-type ATPase [Gordonia sp. SCSIO 19800]MCX2752807.1 heavy metal translocating P-type ATPase [Gordonia sp. 4N]
MGTAETTERTARDSTLTGADRGTTPPSIFRTGLRLPEVRWAGLALALFLAGWLLQISQAPEWSWWTAYLACYLAGGWEPTRSGLQELRERRLDVDLLMIVAAVAAASIGQVFDGALLIVIFATSGALEVVVTQRTADSVTALLGLAPERATLYAPDGMTREIDCRELEVGQRILVRPGERVGADGVVVDGRSEVDQQAVTGESVPVVRAAGDDVLSGTVNGTGALIVEVAHPASESVIARIATLVAEASETKAPTQLFIEKVEQTYSVIVVVATLLVLGVPMVLFGNTFDEALLRAIVFMIVASPCAVVLSTMPPLLASIANAGRHGVLVKSAAVMESVGRTSVVAFDKTGTLTEGRPQVVDVTAFDGHDPSQVLALAAAVEYPSEHPLGRAIVTAAADRGLGVESVEDFRALPGRGVTGAVGGRRVTVERAVAGSTGTVVGVLVDGWEIGRIELVDRLRDDAAEAVRLIGDVTSGSVLLLTGDRPSVAADVADRTGIREVHADLLPEDKVRIVGEIEGHVLVVGDGINDAPALMAAGTGIAMGRRGADLAVQTADAIIVRDDLTAVPALIRLSRLARRYVIANLCIAATVILTLVTWDLIGTLPLPLAVAGHEGSTVLVALNGARLLRKSAWSGPRGAQSKT